MLANVDEVAHGVFAFIRHFITTEHRRFPHIFKTISSSPSSLQAAPR
jgi:hypothetical protein